MVKLTKQNALCCLYSLMTESKDYYSKLVQFCKMNKKYTAFTTLFVLIFEIRITLFSSWKHFMFLCYQIWQVLYVIIKCSSFTISNILLQLRSTRVLQRLTVLDARTQDIFMLFSTQAHLLHLFGQDAKNWWMLFPLKKNTEGKKNGEMKDQCSTCRSLARGKGNSFHPPLKKKKTPSRKNTKGVRKLTKYHWSHLKRNRNRSENKG